MAFIAEQLALEFIRELRPLVTQIRMHDRDLAEQITTAGSSVGLNLPEGRRRAGRDRLHLWRVALGSASEALSALRVAEAWGYVAEEALGPALALGDQVCAVTWRLVHPAPTAAPARGR